MSYPSRAHLSLNALLVALGAILSGCLNVSPPGTAFASEPAGAAVHVDGRDSGWVTPCQIALDPEESHVITLALDGYAAREIRLGPGERLGIVGWHQAVNGARSTTRFPILMPLVDLLLPLRTTQSTLPGRVFMRLRPEAQ